MARQDQRSRRAATRPAHYYQQLDVLRLLRQEVPAGFVAGSQEAQGVEIAASDSWDRFDPGSRFDRADADATAASTKRQHMDSTAILGLETHERRAFNTRAAESQLERSKKPFAMFAA